MSPYCNKPVKPTSLSCTLGWKAVAFCHLYKLSSTIDAKYQVCFNIKLGIFVYIGHDNVKIPRNIFL